MNQATKLLTKSGNTHDTVINTYAEQAKKDIFVEVLQPELSNISKKKMEILSIKESISLRTDANAGLKKMSYKEVKESLKKIVKLEAEVKTSVEAVEFITDSFNELFDEDAKNEAELNAFEAQ